MKTTDTFFLIFITKLKCIFQALLQNLHFLFFFFFAMFFISVNGRAMFHHLSLDFNELSPGVHRKLLSGLPPSSTFHIKFIISTSVNLSKVHLLSWLSFPRALLQRALTASSGFREVTISYPVIQNP